MSLMGSPSGPRSGAGMGGARRWDIGTYGRESAGELVRLWWVPSHLKVHGNDGADELAMQGRLLHPNNLLPQPKHR